MACELGNLVWWSNIGMEVLVRPWLTLGVLEKSREILGQQKNLEILFSSGLL